MTSSSTSHIVTGPRSNVLNEKLTAACQRNGPLREGLAITDAADALGVLVSPETIALLTRRRGWSPARYERWRATNLALTLTTAGNNAPK